MEKRLCRFILAIVAIGLCTGFLMTSCQKEEALSPVDREQTAPEVKASLPVNNIEVSWTNRTSRLVDITIISSYPVTSKVQVVTDAYIRFPEGLTPGTRIVYLNAGESSRTFTTMELNPIDHFQLVSVTPEYDANYQYEVNVVNPQPVVY